MVTGSTDSQHKDVQLTSSEERAFYQETVLLFKAVPTAVLGTFLAIALILYVLWPVIDHQKLIIWSGVFALITILRAFHSNQFFHKRTQLEMLHGWVKQYQLLTLSAAVMWGLMPVFLFPIGYPQHQLILAFIIATTSAVASINIATHRNLVLLYLLIIMLPMTIRFYIASSEMMGVATFMMFMAMLLFIAGAIRINKTIVDNIRYSITLEDSNKQLNHSRQRLALHLRNTPLGVIEWDTQLNVLDWNEAATKIFGYSKQEAKGKSAMELILPQDQQQQVGEVLSELRNKAGGTYSLNENITRDGKTILCEWFNTYLVDDNGEVTGIASLVQDVTERVMLDRMKNEFISTVSHELRTPLTSLRGTLGILQHEAENHSSESQKKLIDIANNNAVRLNALIDDILLIQKLEAEDTEENCEETSVYQLVKAAIEENQGFAVQKNIRLQIEDFADDLLVNVNRVRILQVMANLLSNAIKFSPERTVINVSMIRLGDKVKVEVMDQGYGVDDEFVPKLFNKFTQYDSSATRQFAGTGLGLSIAKNIIDKHHGDIGYRKTGAKGSCFYFTLPLSSQA